MTPEEIKADMAKRREARTRGNIVQMPEPERIADEPEPEPAEIHGTNGSAAIVRPAQRQIIPRQSCLPDIQRLLPQSPDAEQGVLCSMLLAPRELIPKVARELSPRHFHIPAHQTIFREICEMHAADEEVDIITLTQALRNRGELDQIGGAAKVTELFLFLPTAANVDAYLETMRSMHAAREGIRLLTEYSSRLYDEHSDVPALITEVRERITAIALPGVARVRLPKLISIADWSDVKTLPTEPPQVINGFLHQGSKLIIGGTSKGRKTFALLDLAASVHAGANWWGVPTQKGRVCYLNFELQVFSISRRIQWICRKKGVEMTDDCQVMTLRGWTDPIENLAEKLIPYFLSIEPFSLIIFDPVYKLLGNRDENKVGDVTQLLNHIERIGVETGAATAFGHHYSKGNQAAKESIDRMGGSGAFARDPDAILTMTAHEQEDCFTVEPTLRNFAPVSPFVIKWSEPLFLPETSLDPEALKQPRKAPGASDGKKERVNSRLSSAKSKLGRFFADGAQRERGQVAALSRCPGSSFDNYWGDLKDNGCIVIAAASGAKKGLWQASSNWAKEIENDYPPDQKDL